MMLALTLTKQVVYSGFVDGLSIGLLALGIVLIYRSSKVINFAVGSIGALAAGMEALLVVKYHWNFWPSLMVALALGAVFTAAVETTVVTRLFRAPRVILLVATIGIGQLAQAAQTALPHIDADLQTTYPTALHGVWHVAGIRITGPEISVLVAVPTIAALLTWFLTKTDIGKAVRAAAANPDRARLSAINPKLLSTLVWTIAGVLSSLSLIMLAGTSGSVLGLTTIGPNTLARVLAAALIARMVSFPKALGAGVAIGVTQAIVQYNAPTQSGLMDALLLIVVLVASWRITRADDADDGNSFSFSPRIAPVPERLRQLWWVRNLGTLAGIVFFLAASAVPFLATAPSKQILYSRMLAYALIGISLVVLTGWAGQISLGQGAFAGLGALTYAALVNGAHMGLGYGHHRIVWHLTKLNPALALVMATVLTAVVATVVGAGAVRVKGLLLGVVTYVFALAAQQYLWSRPIFSDGSGGVFVRRPTVFGLDLHDQRTFYFLILVVLAIVMVVISRLRRTGIGRSWIAARDNPDSAAAYTVSPARTKLQAFGTAGAIAGLGGALLGALLANINLGDVFGVSDSVNIVSTAVIGGVGAAAGPVLGALWVIGLPAFWPSSTLVPLLTSSLGLLVLLMYFPGGLLQIGYSARDALLTLVERRLPEAEPVAKSAAVPTAVSKRRAQATTADAGPALTASNITVTFGARTVVDGVDLEIRRGEVVGLIGTNGAGKTTLMNAIGGYVPSRGHVTLLGHDVTNKSPGRRAAMGFGRTFQAARLFGDLTVRETLQVALEARHRTHLASAVLFLPGSFRVERRQRADSDEIISFLGLGRYADRFVSELSTGTRRIVELGALLALDAEVLCLDEPTAGVAQRETEAFGPLLLQIRAELDASLLVIEHDMPLIMSISDRIYCLEAGRVIAEGDAKAVRDDAAVIASYLGTDKRAIERSGANNPP